MAFVQVQCPDCYSTDVVQYGKQANGTQRYRCNNRDCPRTIFLLQYQDKGRLPAVRQQIVDMTLNGSGVRDIVRVLRVSSATVIDVLKKTRATSGKDCPVIESGCSDESPGISTSPHFERFYHVPARLCACISSAAAAVANRRLTLGSVRHDWGETTSL